jgi:transcriptional/translational regulatory protein YebC/TACO1
MAVKAGGGPDVEKNRQLAQVIADAKVNNVPRDVIERQLSKAKDATTIGESLYFKCEINPNPILITSLDLTAALFIVLFA